MNYQHQFHAGNFADLFKHCILCCCLQYLKQKDKPLLAIDTHAGAGKYEINNAEATNGIKKLLLHQDFYEAMPPIFWQILAKINITTISSLSKDIRFYAGSPLLIKNILADKKEPWQAIFGETKQSVHYLLKRNFAGNKKIILHKNDGFALLKSKLPPLQKRAMVLIDPPYEKDQNTISADYNNSIIALQQAYKRFASGVYLWWYPIIDKQQHIVENAINNISNIGFTEILTIEIDIDNPDLKMQKCGMLIINPPWQLQSELQNFLPKLLTIIGGSKHQCKFLVKK